MCSRFQDSEPTDFGSPEPILQGIAGEIQNYSIRLAEKVQKDGALQFEVKVTDTANHEKYELLFSDTGKLVEKSGMKKEEKEETEEMKVSGEEEED